MERRHFLRLAGLSLGLLIPGAATRSAAAGYTGPGLYLPPVEPGAPAVSSTIYLTFDDGYIGISEKVAALNALGVPGTFFLVGLAMYGDPQGVEYLVNSGHSIGNHTYSHSYLTGLNYGGIAWEIQACEKAAWNVAGIPLRPYLRPPYGAVNNFVRSVAADYGYTTLLWDWDTRDWAGTSAAYIAQNVGPGVVLMHTQGYNTVGALYDIVPALADRGYTFALF